MRKMRTVQGLMGCTLSLLSPQKHACEFGSVNCHFHCSLGTDVISAQGTRRRSRMGRGRRLR